MKKLFSITLIMVLILSLFTQVAYAAESDTLKVLNDVNKTNDNIEQMIDKAVDKAEKEMEKYNQDNYNRIDKKIENMITNLIKNTDKKAANIKEKALEKGVIVDCEYIDVEIGGQNIKIDPLRVVGI